MVKEFSTDKVINVITREETMVPEPCFVIVREEKKYCPHAHLNIFQHHRRVFCKDCGATLDAFEALLSMANKDNQCISEMRWRQYELKTITEEKMKLENEIRNLKAQKRKLV